MADHLDIDIEALLSQHAAGADEPELTDRQRAILAAAEKLFSELGYAQTPTATIAKEAGVTERTLFKHFRSKAELFKRVLVPILMRTLLPVQMRRVSQMVQAGQASFQDFFQAFARDRWSTATQHASPLRLLASTLLQDDKLRADFGKLWSTHVWRQLVASIERYQAEGKLRTDVDAELVARMQIFLVAGQAVTRGLLVRDRAWDDDEEARRMARILWEGLAPR